MHLAALSSLLLNSRNNPSFKNLISKINNECLIGTIAYSDPQTGSHAWFPLSSKSEETPSGWKIFKRHLGLLQADLLIGTWYKQLATIFKMIIQNFLVIYF